MRKDTRGLILDVLPTGGLVGATARSLTGEADAGETLAGGEFVWNLIKEERDPWCAVWRARECCRC